MDVQKTTPEAGLFTRRFLAEEIFFGAENRATALFYSGLSFALLALFSGAHAVFGAYPFAIAYLAAANRRLLPALAGALVGTLPLGDRGYIYAIACLFVVGVRLLLSRPHAASRILPPSPRYFGEEPALRVATACVCGFFPAVYQLLIGGLSLASVAFSLSMVIFPTLSSVLFLYFFESGETLLSALTTPKIAATHNTRSAWALALSLASISFVAVLALRSYDILGISPAYLAAAGFAFLYVRQLGLLRGGIAACFAAAGVLDLSYLPAFLALSVGAALAARIGLFPMLVFGVAAGQGIAFLCNGVQSVLSFLPEAVLAAVLIFPLFQHLPTLASLGDTQEEKARAAAAGEARRYLPPSVRLEHLSGAFRGMGDIFARLSEVASHPSQSEYYAVCRRVFDRHCTDCPGHRACYECGNKPAKEALLLLSAQLGEGAVRADITMPEGLRSACHAHAALFSDLLSACATLEQEKCRADGQGFLAQNCRTTADVLADVAQKESAEWEEDAAAAAAVCAALRRAGISARHVTVFGKRRRMVMIFDLPVAEAKERGDVLRRVLEEACASRFSPPIFESEGTHLHMRAQSTPRFSLSSYHAATPIRGEEVSGDTFSAFLGADAYYYGLLSDGMGSGRTAAITSGICGAFLRQMLSAGLGKATALRALNALLCERGEECSATIDMLEVDLYSGQASFVKSGAALSYVKRGDSLFRIHAGTLPIGILPELDAEQVDFTLQGGDVVIMISDGVNQTPDDALWLCDMLCNAWEEDPETMADKILAGARRHSEQGDDMTVALLTVQEMPA